jgi:metallophosphoesterase (TIGR00282 family)
MFRILFIGDIVGSVGRKAVKEQLPHLINEHRPDFVIANGENVAAGKGITRPMANELFGMGVHLLTMGNHTWDQKEIFQFIDEESRIIRPANFPNGVPGNGYCTIKVKGQELTVINLQGRTFMPTIDCPFQKVDEILKKVRSKLIFVDFHAEATSEKLAMGWYLDGRVSAIVGTHTHVQTNDARMFTKGTAYITDVGMTGPRDGILGVAKDIVIQRFLNQLPARFTIDEGKYHLNAVCVDLKLDGNALKITPIVIHE